MQATVGDLKEQLVSKAAVPKERQRLIWRGRVLQDGQLLDEAGELAMLAPVPCLTSALNLHLKLALTSEAASKPGGPGQATGCLLMQSYLKC